ncbi:SDR family oxidoreductase [Gordonia hydrophobica]|uniref:SDR family oxidoreductase n=1 Tax=Gordonia hydrophobica TaxID=40516 RepID=A0ABZ2U6Y1_9ACTN|nr:SDR family oxidoreductase [Gordonia hydrophobica]MBM7368244.1 NAD(P)-dependent dehydrogenase (short-subunit alcohol dehydrogenase family) [Gordonia hydrophobica]
MNDALFSVAGKKVLVTGGTRGIGYMIAEGLLDAGAEVIISSRKAEACDSAQAELSKHGTVTAIPADLSDPEQSQRLADAVAEITGELHVLVNNAGATWGGDFDTFPVSGWDKVLNLNLRAPFVLAQQLRPLLDKASRADDPARVINIGSIDGIAVPTFDNFSYSAAKAGLHHLTKHMAAALAPSILVNAIAPGPFPTKMLAPALADGGEQIRASNPLGRIGEPADAAALATFLSARGSSFITGTTIPLDGGLSTTMTVG